ncbi:E3 SUMO-protein ligase ZBED1-like [Argopecten irradians]|uniref:E3 SUMO-protein ligase ZBED1-like n=1 Tax=Argopecten irradians TaxID=31199 RepID=UPI00371C271C
MTHDGWTSCSTESYNTTTIHYINKDWDLKTATLNTKKMDGSHTAERLAESILETKSEWCLKEVVATTDNAANEVKAFKLLQWTRFGCFGHRINLIVKKALEQPDISRVLGKGRRLVTLYHSSSSINDYLKEKQQLLLSSMLVGHKLIADVPRRWNSSLMMLTRLNEQMPALLAVAADDRVNKSAKSTMKNCLYSFEESSTVEKVIELLQPFKTATEIMCSEKIPTISKVLPTVMKLKKMVVIKEDDPPIIRTIKTELFKQLELRTETEEISLLGTILNPFTKGFEFLPEKKTEAENILRRLASGVKVVIKKEKNDDDHHDEFDNTDAPPLPNLPSNLLDQEPDLPLVSSTSDAAETYSISDEKPDSEDTETSPKKRKVVKSKDTEDWLSDIVCMGVSSANKEDAVQAEISRYLGTSLRDCDTNHTLLEWWKKMKYFFQDSQ